MLTCAYDDAALRAALKSDFETLSSDITSAPQINAIIARLLQTALAVSRDLARDWNESRSGTRLPAEVLAGAFKFLPLRDRIAASHVSRHWRQSALAFPEVWNHIDLGPGRLRYDALIGAALSRSGQIPVVISHRAAVDYKGTPVLGHALLAVHMSRRHDIGLDMYNINTDGILLICKTLTANAVDLCIGARVSHGGDEGFSLTVSTSHALIRRLWLTGIPPRPNGRRQDARELAGLALRSCRLDGLHSLTVDSTVLRTLPTHLPPGLCNLTLHMRELERVDDAGSGDPRVTLLVDILVRAMVAWDSLDVLPRLTMQTQSPVHVLLYMHGHDLLPMHAQRLLDKIESLALSHLPPVHIRGFSADIVSAVSLHSVADRVVFEM